MEEVSRVVLQTPETCLFLKCGYRHTQFLYVGAEDLNSALHACEDVLLPTEPSSQHYRLL